MNLRILDVGSGASALPILLARRGAKVISVDPAPLYVDPPNGVVRVRAALPRLPFRASAFDIVCCISVLEHLNFSVDDCLTELLRLARRQAVITFDLALGPLAFVGLSGVELRTISKVIGKKLMFPSDPLEPTGGERRAFGPQLGVGLLSISKQESGWPEVRLSRFVRRLVCIHRMVQKVVPVLLRPRAVIRWLKRRLGTGPAGVGP